MLLDSDSQAKFKEQFKILNELHHPIGTPNADLKELLLNMYEGLAIPEFASSLQHGDESISEQLEQTFAHFNGKVTVFKMPVRAGWLPLPLLLSLSATASLSLSLCLSPTSCPTLNNTLAVSESHC